MAKTISDEQIIAALIQTGTISEAAKVAGCTTRTLYNRMQERSFVEIYEATKCDILRMAVFGMGREVQSATTTIAEIMANPEVDAKIRVQAAQTILSDAVKFSSLLADAEFQARQKSGDDLPLSRYFHDF